MIDYLTELKTEAAIEGATLYMLCEKAGVAISNVPRWEKEQTSPNMSTLNKLRSALEQLRKNKPTRKR